MADKKKDKPDSEKIAALSKQPPAAMEIESAVLGAMLIEPEAVPKAIEVLQPTHFYAKKHEIIFTSMISLFDSNEPIDTVTLYEDLKKDGKLEAVGGASYLSQLTHDVSTAANIEYHARIILEKWILRQLIKTSIDIADLAIEGSEDVMDLLDVAEAKIFKIAEQSLKESYKSMDKAVHEAVEHIMSIHSQKISTFSVPSGFLDLDEMLGGFQRSDLIIVAARPSMGKTAFALSLVRNAAVDHKVPIVFFSLEMATLQLVTRLISSQAEMDAHSIRTGKFRAEDGQRISRTAHKLSEAPIYIDDAPGQSVTEIRAKCRRLKAEKDIGMVVIDYMQLMTAGMRMESREREISQISRSLKALAKELNIPVIALAQLNRAVEARTDKRPMLSDLRESGSIEQDADVVLFLNRPEYYGIKAYPDGESTEGIGEVIVGKQRNGPTGDVKLRFISQYAKFENLELRYNQIPQSAESASGMEGDFPI